VINYKFNNDGSLTVDYKLEDNITLANKTIKVDIYNFRLSMKLMSILAALTQYL
jgi:hypothetical protein